MVSGVEASEGNELTHVGEGGEGTTLGDEFGSGEGTDTWDGIDEVTLMFEVRGPVDMLGVGFESIIEKSSSLLKQSARFFSGS